MLNVLKILNLIDKKTGERYDAFVQAVDLNFDGKYYMRYSIGIMNYQGFHNLFCIYDNDEFNETFKVDGFEIWYEEDENHWNYKKK